MSMITSQYPSHANSACRPCKIIFILDSRTRFLSAGHLIAKADESTLAIFTAMTSKRSSA